MKLVQSNLITNCFDGTADMSSKNKDISPRKNKFSQLSIYLSIHIYMATC